MLFCDFLKYSDLGIILFQSHHPKSWEPYSHDYFSSCKNIKSYHFCKNSSALSNRDSCFISLGHLKLIPLHFFKFYIHFLLSLLYSEFSIYLRHNLLHFLINFLISIIWISFPYSHIAKSHFRDQASLSLLYSIHPVKLLRTVKWITATIKPRSLSQ